MADLIPATGHVAVFTGIDTHTGRTRYYARPLLAWTVGDDGRLVGHCIGSDGRTHLAASVPNFLRYMTKPEWERHSLDLLSNWPSVGQRS